MELVIETLSKQFGSILALKDFSLKSGPGLIGLIGPNGAGKTTLMRIIATLLPQTQGLVKWNGLDTRREGQQIRRALGYLPQEFGLYPEFSGRKFLQYLAAMKGLPKEQARRRVSEVLEVVNLEKIADRKLSTYSGGMKQRVGIAQALLNDPALLIVDEPTVGLDPAERVRFRTLLSTLTANRLIIFSTHIIGDVETVANRLIVLREGQKLVDTTPEAFQAKAFGKVWQVTTNHAAALHLQTLFQVSGMVNQGGQVQLRVISAEKPTEGAMLIEPSLEDAYLLTVGAQGVEV